MLVEGASLAAVEYCEAYLRDTPPEEINPPQLLTGDDLIAHGLRPGTEFKALLDRVAMPSWKERSRRVKRPSS